MTISKTLTDLYKEDNNLTQFTHLHFYKSDVLGAESFQIKKHITFTVLGINSNTGTMRWIPKLLDGDPNYRFDEIRCMDILKGITIGQMGFWEDGSFFITSHKLFEYPDILSTFYLIQN